MDFALTDSQRSWTATAHALGRELAGATSAGDIVKAAARAGLLGPQVDMLAAALAVEALACESAAAGIVLAIHTAAILSVDADARIALTEGDVVGALALSSEEVPSLASGTLSGRACWVGPIGANGLGVVGARSGDGMSAWAVALDAPGVRIEPVLTSGLRGFACAHVTFTDVACATVDSPTRVMTRARTLIAAVALGIGARALRESLSVARRDKGVGGEQTVQGLLADSATELDAARLLTWNAAVAPGERSLASASMAKLAAAGAAHAAVARATQVVGVDSFRSGHVLEELTQDVRAIELFAGRTEALREAVADEELPRT